MIKIDVIGIGSGKSGSTWLYANIVKHPEICDKNPKEIRFFDLHYNKGLDWYVKQFSGCEELLKGEFSVQYMSHSESATRIKKHFPDVKLLAILRNPSDRIFSDYLHSIRKGDIRPDSPFLEYIKDAQKLKYGLYYEQLLPFCKEFPPGQIKVVLLEEVENDPAKVLKDVYRFIGVSDVDFLPADLNEKVNEATEYKFLAIENLITNTSRFLNNVGFTILVERLKRSGMPAFIRKINAKGKSEKTMNKDSRMFLNRYFRASNEKLSELINRDLSLWK